MLQRKILNSNLECKIYEPWEAGSYQNEFDQTPRGSGRQEGLACSDPWGHKESDTTKRLNNNDNPKGQNQGSPENHSLTF